MKINNKDLMNKMLYIPMGLILLSIITVIIFTPKMYVTAHYIIEFDLIATGLVISAILSFFSSIRRISYGISLIKKNNDIELIRGEVTKIKKIVFAPKVAIDDKKYVGKVVVVDDIKYFIFIDESIKYNSHIWFNVLRGSKLVSEWGFYLKSSTN